MIPQEVRQIVICGLRGRKVARWFVRGVAENIRLTARRLDLPLLHGGRGIYTVDSGIVDNDYFLDESFLDIIQEAAVLDGVGFLTTPVDEKVDHEGHKNRHVNPHRETRATLGCATLAPVTRTPGYVVALILRHGHRQMWLALHRETGDTEKASRPQVKS